MSGAANRGRGFTLIEVMIALTLAVLVTAALGSALRTAFKARDACEQAVGGARTADLIFELIRGDLVSAVPPGDVAVNPTPMVGEFLGTDAGSSDDLTMFTTAAAPDRPAANCDLKQVEWTIGVPVTTGISGTSTGGTCLLRRITRNLLSDAVVTPDEQVVCRGVTGLNFRYFDGTDWADAWSSTDQADALPLAVEVTVEMDPGAQAGSGVRGVTPPPLRYVRVFRLPCSTLSTNGTTGGAP